MATIDRFLERRRAQWAELESMVHQGGRGRFTRSETGDLERFGRLYRHASGDLAIARRDYPGQAVTEYLNSLCSRAHPLLYRSARAPVSAVPRYIATGIPQAFRAARPYVLASLALLVAGALAGWMAVELRPDLKPSLVPSSLFDRMARGDTQGHIPDPAQLSPLIILNNVRVAITCLVLGVLLGIPTALVLLVNGWTIGTLAAAVHDGGYDLQFWSLIVPHGVLELSIIVIAGATGLMVGDSVLRPGLLSRGDALAGATARALWLALGAATLLIIAGCIEGFVSPSDLPTSFKLAVGAGSGLSLYSWLFLAGRRRRARPRIPLGTLP